VAEIIEEWRSHSSKGRYKDDIWRPEILNDLVGSGSGASTGSGVPSVGSGEGDREEQVDAFEAGGLFRMFGRMANQDAVRARAFPPASGLPTPGKKRMCFLVNSAKCPPQAKNFLGRSTHRQAA
jgi:hypothetical protein